MQPVISFLATDFFLNTSFKKMFFVPTGYSPCTRGLVTRLQQRLELEGCVLADIGSMLQTHAVVREALHRIPGRGYEMLDGCHRHVLDLWKVHVPIPGESSEAALLGATCALGLAAAGYCLATAWDEEDSSCDADDNDNDNDNYGIQGLMVLNYREQNYAVGLDILTEMFTAARDTLLGCCVSLNCTGLTRNLVDFIEAAAGLENVDVKTFVAKLATA